MIQNWLGKIPPFFRSFYFIAGFLFFAWLLIFDSNDLVSQMKLSNKKNELEETKTYYEDKIAEVKEEREAFLSSEELLEKVAREKYLMKKEGEDVFVVVDEE
jgi:cell division protein DivIC